jgi:hypothetical protein
VPDTCFPRIIFLNDYSMEDNLLSEITTDQTDTTTFSDIYDLFIFIYDSTQGINSLIRESIPNLACGIDSPVWLGK